MLSCSRHKEQLLSTRVYANNNAAIVTAAQLLTCCTVSTCPTKPPSFPAHASISQPHHLAHSPHRWPGREAEAGAGCQLTLSGRRSPSTGGNGDISSLGILCKIAAAPQPHLTWLFLLRFLRAVVASPLNARIQSATERCPPPGERRSVETTVWSRPSVPNALLLRYCADAEPATADWWNIKQKPASEQRFVCTWFRHQKSAI